MKNIINKELKLNEIDCYDWDFIKNNFDKMTEQQQLDFVKKWLNKKSIEAIGEPIYVDYDKLEELDCQYLKRKKEILSLPKNVEKENDLFNLKVWYNNEKARIIKQKMKS